MRVTVLLLIGAVAVLAQGRSSTNDDGEALYRERCASCHDGSVARAPRRGAIAHLSAESIRVALTSGNMQSQASGLTTQQIEVLVRVLTTVSTPGATKTIGMCTSAPPPLTDALSKPHWNGWGVTPAQRRFQPAAMAGLTRDSVKTLTLKWAFGFPDVIQAHAQPAVVGGRVFVGTAARKVYSLDARTGCQYWAFETDGPVRTAITLGDTPRGWLVYFGDAGSR